MNPILMKCTQEQYNKIKPILLENGFKEENISCFEQHPYLINNWGPEDYKLGNGDLDYAIGRKVFNEWNEDIFLVHCDIILKKEQEFVLGKTWHIKVTEENQNIVSEWRFTDTSKKLNIGYVTGMYDWDGRGTHICKEHNSYKDDNNWGDEITFEQFKKYVLKQEETYKYTPEYCKNNKVAIFVKTQSDIDGLNELGYKECISNLNDCPNGFYTVPSKDSWGIDRTYFNKNYFVINASEFIKNNLKTTNMEKKIIGYKLIKPEYEEVALTIAQLCSWGEEAKRLYVNLHRVDCINRIKEAGVLDLWFAPVYESLETKYTMGSNGNTFELIVKDGRCFHKQEDITNYLRDVQEFARRLPTKFGNYDFKLDIDSIKINKTGCESKETLLSQWLNIKL